MFLTRDSGRTWSGPTTVANDGKTHWNPYLAYSPKGVLGLVWRTNEGAAFPALTPYSIWAAISNNGAHVQPAARRSTAARQRPSLARSRVGDILQDLFGDRPQQSRRLRRAWGDWRTGERNIFFSAIKYQAFSPR